MQRTSMEAQPWARATGDHLHAVIFVVFFWSGFCSLVYQVVWIRLAFSHFGVLTPVLSCLLSVFMLGLGLGSALGGRWARWWDRVVGGSSAYLYAAIEGMIGLGAFAVPFLFQTSWEVLLSARAGVSSGGYLLASGVLILIAVLPWCILMGATIPVMMSFIRQAEPRRGSSSFSFLYLANVMGAMTGTLLSALVLIELFGFRQTSTISATINFLVAAVSLVLAWSFGSGRAAEPQAQLSASPSLPSPASGGRFGWASAANGGEFGWGLERWLEIVLFTTGLTSLAMEVVWTRAFTFVLKTTIYSFAMILATYLLATWVGSYLYRRALTAGRMASVAQILGALCVFSLLPALLDDPRFNQSIALTLGSIVPFCLALGYLTPRLIDAHSRGNPTAAGRAYSINIAGGILGPLLAGYALLPTIGTRAALLALSAPIFALYIGTTWAAEHAWRRRIEVSLSFAALFAFAAFVSRGYEDGIFYPGRHEVRRDHAATVVAYGEGMNQRLLVNGVGMTFPTPITKIMAHLPLAMNGHAKAGLVICFGMGTTFRSMHSWEIDTTAVELSRSVAESFGFFFPDFQQILSDPSAHIAIDDGRRYLVRTNKKFDVITLDPPPPIEAAVSSLLYSEEFYGIVRDHLAPGGILQQWFPGGEDKIQYAVARSLIASFPYVVAFRSIEDWGYHFLASMSPIDDLTPQQLVSRLPEGARRDLMEWSADQSIEKIAESILTRRTDVRTLLPPRGEEMIVTDDRPYNEYFFLRRTGLLN